MDAALKALLEKKQGLLVEQKAILDQDDTKITQEGILKAREIEGTIKGVNTEIGRYTDLASLRQVSEAESKTLTSPVIDVGVPGMMVTVKESGATMMGGARGGGLWVDSYGEGHVGEKAWKAIKSAGYKEMFWNRYLRGGFAQMSNEEQKVLQEGSDPSGGYTVPEDFINRVIMKKPTPTRVAGYTTSFNTSRDSITLPRVVYATDDLYTTGVRVTMAGEVPATAGSIRATDPVFGQVRVPVYTFMLSLPITNDMIEDSAIDMQPWLEMIISQTIELLYDNMILNGTGVSQPAGVLFNPGGTDQPAVITSGSASALTADGIEACAWSVPEQYEENLRWVFNKTNTGKAVALLKDGNGRYLWGAGMQDSGISPGIYNGPNVRQLVGYPVNFSGFMPNVAANAYSAIFGDFGGYYLVRRIGLSIQVLREVYAEVNQIMLVARVRFGGMVAEPWRLKAHQVHT